MFEASASGQSLPLVSKSTQPQNQSKCVHSLLLTVYAPVKVMTDLEWSLFCSQSPRFISLNALPVFSLEALLLAEMK